MTILDSVKNGFTGAVDTVSGIAQTIIEKNRLNAQLNRLRTVMKNECEMINRAYITLGKKYYENKVSGKSETCANEEELFLIIENSKKQIVKARERYRQLIEARDTIITNEYDSSDLEDITVACSNEDEYDESPFESSATADEAVEDAVEEAVDTVSAEPEIAEEDSF